VVVVGIRAFFAVAEYIALASVQRQSTHSKEEEDKLCTIKLVHKVTHHSRHQANTSSSIEEVHDPWTHHHQRLGRSRQLFGASLRLHTEELHGRCLQVQHSAFGVGAAGDS
jgi:hypothetical protein